MLFTAGWRPAGERKRVPRRRCCALGARALPRLADPPQDQS